MENCEVEIGRRQTIFKRQDVSLSQKTINPKIENESVEPKAFHKAFKIFYFKSLNWWKLRIWGSTDQGDTGQEKKVSKKYR